MSNKEKFKIEKDLVDYMDSLIDGTYEQLHLAQIVNLAYELESKVSTDFFSKDKIDTLNIQSYYDSQDGNIVRFDFYDKSKSMIFKTRMVNRPNKLVEDIEQAEFIDKLFSEIAGFFDDYTSLIEEDHYYLELKPGISEDILNLFLSKDLRTKFDHDELQFNLANNNQNKSQKLKI